MRGSPARPGGPLTSKPTRPNTFPVFGRVGFFVDLGGQERHRGSAVVAPNFARTGSRTEECTDAKGSAVLDRDARVVAGRGVGVLAGGRGRAGLRPARL